MDTQNNSRAGEPVAINSGDITVGQPLPWSLYDGSGQLLLRKGYVIPDETRLDRLLERGLYRINTPDTPPKATKSDNRPLTPFEIITQLELRLRALFDDLFAKSPGTMSRITSFCTDLQQLCNTDPDAALGALHLKHDGDYTIFHPIHTALLCELLCRRLAIDEKQRIPVLAAALTANIGMIELQRELQVQQGPLSQPQRDVLMRHPQDATAILVAADIDDSVWLEAVLQHHERPDGSGYPHGLHADRISLPARILALTDIYCAMITPRSYRGEILAREALANMFLKRGEEVDNDLVQHFIREMGIFPPGALVRLTNGEHAIVIKRGRESKNPLVQAVAAPRGAPYDVPRQRDSARPEFVIKEMLPRDQTPPLDIPALWGYARGTGLS